MYEYISRIVEEIIKINSSIFIDFNIKKYKYFLTKERLYEIKIHERYGLISPQVYNICYLYLTKEKGICKQEVIDLFINVVNANKKQMKIIIKQKYTPKDYAFYLDEIKKAKERKHIIANKNTNTNEKINWDIDEYEVVRGDWNAFRV